MFPIRDHNPSLAAWEKDLLTIVHEEAMYFLPQIETKIMNEGWASYWHHKIMNRTRNVAAGKHLISNDFLRVNRKLSMIIDNVSET